MLLTEAMSHSPWYWVKTVIPIAKPSPLGTFLPRSLVKWRQVTLIYLLRSAASLGFIGAKSVGREINGNLILKLNRNSALGRRGDLIQIPEDTGIFEKILTRGKWEIDECRFLSRELQKISEAGSKSDGTLVDIGANCGWNTLQTLALAKSRPRVVMVEPVPKHLDAIKFNTSRFSDIYKFEFVPFALSDRNGKASIFTEENNQGNSSLIRSVVARDREIQSTIDLMNTDDFVREYLNSSDALVIKCDIQGLDAAVLAMFPFEVWSRVQAAVIEIWAVEGVHASDVDKCLEYWKKFSNISWSAEGKELISLTEISDFWLGGDRRDRNLFLHM